MNSNEFKFAQLEKDKLESILIGYFHRARSGQATIDFENQKKKRRRWETFNEINALSNPFGKIEVWNLNFKIEIKCWKYYWID